MPDDPTPTPDDLPFMAPIGRPDALNRAGHFCSVEEVVKMAVRGLESALSDRRVFSEEDIDNGDCAYIACRLARSMLQEILTEMRFDYEFAKHAPGQSTP